MNGFFGFYTHRTGERIGNARTFFFGYAKTIRGIDLSINS